MDSNFLKQLCNEYKDLSGFISFTNINDVDLFYKEGLFDLPSLLLLNTIDNEYFKLQDYYSNDLFSQKNSLGIPYDVFYSLCSIGHSSRYVVSNLKSMDARLTEELLSNVEEGTSFILFTKQREYFQSIYPDLEKIDSIYDKKYSVYLKTNAFLYVYQNDTDDFSSDEKKLYIEAYLHDLKKILCTANSKEKLDNKSIKNLKYAIKRIFEEFNQNELTDQAKKDNIFILLYYNHFLPSSGIQQKIKEILGTAQDIDFAYNDHEKILLKKIKEKNPEIYSMIYSILERNYLTNNLSSSLDNANLSNKKRL